MHKLFQWALDKWLHAIVLKTLIRLGIGSVAGAVADYVVKTLDKRNSVDFHEMAIIALTTGITAVVHYLDKSPLEQARP